MAVPTTPAAWRAGQIATADQLNLGVTPPCVELVQAGVTATSLAHNDWTAIAWNLAGVITDTEGGWSAGSPTRYTVQVAGLYLVAGSVCFATNGTGVRGVSVWKNGAGIPATGMLPGSTVLGGFNPALATKTALVRLAIGDYLETRAFHTAGAALNTQPGAQTLTSSLTAVWVAA